VLKISKIYLFSVAFLIVAGIVASFYDHILGTTLVFLAYQLYLFSIFYLCAFSIGKYSNSVGLKRLLISFCLICTIAFAYLFCVSSPLFMYQFDLEFRALADACPRTDAVGCDCTL